MADDDDVTASGNMVGVGYTATGRIKLSMYVGEVRHVYEFHPIDAVMIARMIAHKVEQLAGRVASN